MNILVLKNNKVLNFIENLNSDYLGFYVSFIIHTLLLIFAIGLPNFFEPKQIIVPTIIPIEIVNIAEETYIPKEVNDKKNAETKQKKAAVKEKKFNSSENQEIKKIEIKDNKKTKQKEVIEFNSEKKISSNDNKLIQEKKEAPIELEKKKIDIETNNYESLPTKKIKPKLKPQPQKTEEISKSDVIVNPKPKPSINAKTISEENPKPKPKPRQEFNIASMLKDLRNEKTSPKLNEDKDTKKDDFLETKDDEIEEKAQLSISEIDLVLQQISRCFISPAGAKINKTMFVKISAKVQKNRKVLENSIRIVDTNISKSSPVYGPITESAMRTLLNPECIPLKLPEDKYDLWKNLTLEFDYSVMRGN